MQGDHGRGRTSRDGGRGKKLIEAARWLDRLAEYRAAEEDPDHTYWTTAWMIDCPACGLDENLQNAECPQCRGERVIEVADPAAEVDHSQAAGQLACQPGGWLAEVGIVIEARAAIGGGMDSGRPGLDMWARARGLNGGPSWWLFTAIGIVDGEIERLRRDRARERTKDLRAKRRKGRQES